MSFTLSHLRTNVTNSQTFGGNSSNIDFVHAVTLTTTLPSVTLLGTEIKPVTVAKDLGVHIDCYLNYNEHDENEVMGNFFFFFFFFIMNISLKPPLTVCLN